MLLLHQVGSLHVGEVVRYAVTYSPSSDRILPTPTELYVKVRNTSAVPLRAAYLHGPYILYVSCYPSNFNPYEKSDQLGHPQFEPNLRAGGSWDAVIPLPPQEPGLGKAKETTWIVEISSQVLFSTSAEVPFELLIGRDEKSIELVGSSKVGLPAPGDIRDHIVHNLDGSCTYTNTPKGVYSPALKLKVDDSASLWSSPGFPSYHEKYLLLTANNQGSAREDNGLSFASKDHANPANPRKQKRVHFVVVTHGLHSNVSADMLFLKESIDAAANNAKEASRRKRETRQRQASSSGIYRPKPEKSRFAHLSPEEIKSDRSTDANLNFENDEASGVEGDDDEEVIVRGFPGNVLRTERGIQYLGKRLAKYVLLMTYPDQPYLPAKITHSRHSMRFAHHPPQTAPDEVREQLEENQRTHGYKITSISFIGHSLGGLVQTYALAYIQKHSPEFFERIRPVNFIALATPFLGLNHENPLYVRFALDFGLVGRTGQDLGLAWSTPSKVRSGWDAMLGGLGNSTPKPKDQAEANSKPLLRILPTGAAHQALSKFENRTIYANVVNDGVVPLRTSSLLFLDWKGLERVEKARRDTGLVTTMAEWGWAELTGVNTTAKKNRLIPDSAGHASSAKASSQKQDKKPVTAEAANQEQMCGNEYRSRSSSSSSSSSSDSDPSLQVPSSRPQSKDSASQSPLASLLSFFRFQKQTPASKKKVKIYKRSQTLPPTLSTEVAKPSFATGENDEQSGGSRTRESLERVRDDGQVREEMPALPPKTTLLEAAGDILNPPLPSLDFISDPASRPKTIFHDRIYEPNDIPFPSPAKTRTFFSTSSSASSTHSNNVDDHNSSSDHQQGHPHKKGSGMEVEEKIARAYHSKLSWRKVLVRLEPDAHNNIIVRRMFSNAYGWPVVKHLVDNHFSGPSVGTEPCKAGEAKRPSSTSAPQSMDMVAFGNGPYADTMHRNEYYPTAGGGDASREHLCVNTEKDNGEADKAEKDETVSSRHGTGTYNEATTNALAADTKGNTCNTGDLHAR